MSAENKKKVQKKNSIFLKVFAGILLIVAAMVAAIPTILSMDFVRKLVVDKANAMGAGKLDIDSMYFSWFSGNGVNGLHFSDELGHKVDIKDIKVSEGIAGMIGWTINFGTITFSSPEISIVTIKTETVPGTGDRGRKAASPEKSDVRPGEGRPQATPAHSPKPFSIPIDVAGTIKVENGRASVQEPGGGRKHEFERINCVIGVKSLNSPVTVEAGLSQVGGGAFRVSGTVKALENGVLDPAKVTADISAQVVAVDLEPFALMAASVADVPSVKGTLDVTVSLKVNGIGQIGAEGGVTVSGLLLSGGPLGLDRPKFDTSVLKFSLVVENRNVNIKSFDLNTPFLTATASGLLADKGGKYPEGNIALNARLDIPRLAAQLPATLKIAKGVLISKGEVIAKAEISSVSSSLACVVDMKLADLEAKSDGKVTTLSHPVQLQSRIVMMPEGPRIEKCLLSSSFANLSGRGDLKDLQVTFSADIAQAMEEVRKFIDVGKGSAAGQISGVSRIQSISATERKATTRMTVDALKVSGAGPTPFVLDTARAGLDMLVKTTTEGKVTEICGIKLSLDSAPVSARLEIAGIVPGDKPEKAEVRGLELKAQADVKNIFAIGHGMGAIPVDTDGAGRVEIVSSGKMDKGLLMLDPVSIEVNNLNLSVKGKKLSEPRVTVKCSVEADVVKHNFKVVGLNKTMTAGTVEVPLLSVADWTSKVPSIKGSGTLRLSIGKLFAQMGDFFALPPGSSVSGDLACGFSINPAKDAQAFGIDAAINNLKIKPVSGSAVNESVIRLVLNADQDISTGDIDIRDINVESSMLALKAHGSLTDVKKEKILKLEGVQTCDFRRIGEIVTAVGGSPVEMEGKREKKFHVKTALADTDWKKILKKTDADVGLYLGKLKAFGVEVEGLEFSALAGKGLVRTDISTKVNEGDLKMKPEVNAAGEEAFLSIPDGSLVLKNVKITESMMSDLIAKVHPLLRGCAVTSGKTDLVLNKCYVPLDPKMKNRISVEGDLVLTNLVIEPGGALKDLLNLAGQDLKPLVVPHEVISFVCRDGRLTPSPLTIGNGDYSMTLTGFVTLDGMMKFVASVPVTAKMTGKKIGKYVKDITVKVPIEGPVAKPVISGGAIKEAAGNLVEDAAANLIKEEGAKFLNDLFNKKKEGPAEKK